jgi:hypothetical protein
VTGGGWITSPTGAYRNNTELTGRANFGLTSKYLKGANVPTGNTQFDFHVANFIFQSTSYQWLVVSGAKAQYKGFGTVNGSGKYGFLLTATDSAVKGGGTADAFRLKVWVINADQTDGSVVYDNQVSGDTTDTATPATFISGGNIAIQSSK